MNRRFTIALIGALGLVALPITAQPGASKSAVPRAADGHPDLSGLWTNVTITPLERPRELAGKEFFTEQEALDYEKSHVRNRDDREKIKGTDAEPVGDKGHAE